MFALTYYKDDSLIAGFGLGYTLYTCSMFAPIICFNIGFYTLLCQAYGAKEMRLMGIFILFDNILIYYLL